VLKAIYWIEVVWLSIDTISGYFQNTGTVFIFGDSLSSIIRVAISALFLIALTWLSIAKFLIIIGLITINLMVIICQGFLFEFSLGFILPSLEFGFKLILPLLMYFVISEQIGQRYLRRGDVNTILVVNTLVLVSNIYVSLIGVGFGQYGFDERGNIIGGKGFFYAGNEVAVTLVCLMALCLHWFKDAIISSSFRLVLLVAVYTTAALLTFSKTAIFGSLILSFLFCWTEIRAARFYGFLALTSVLATIVYYGFNELISDLGDRWSFFLERAPSIISFVTSGRADKIPEFFNANLAAYNGAEVFLGRGFVSISSGKMFENDLLDLMYTFGVFGLLIFSFWFASSVRPSAGLCYRNWRSSRFGRLSVLLVLAISIGGGHVLYSALLAPFLGLLVWISKNRIETGLK